MIEYKQQFASYSVDFNAAYSVDRTIDMLRKRDKNNQSSVRFTSTAYSLSCFEQNSLKDIIYYSFQVIFYVEKSSSNSCLYIDKMEEVFFL